MLPFIHFFPRLACLEHNGERLLVHFRQYLIPELALATVQPPMYLHLEDEEDQQECRASEPRGEQHYEEQCLESLDMNIGLCPLI